MGFPSERSPKLRVSVRVRSFPGCGIALYHQMMGFPSFGRFETPISPTGSQVMASEMFIFTITGGKIQSYAVELDGIGMLRQLGWDFLPPRNANGDQYAENTG